jgi:hypothetical protein
VRCVGPAAAGCLHVLVPDWLLSDGALASELDGAERGTATPSAPGAVCALPRVRHAAALCPDSLFARRRWPAALVRSPANFACPPTALRQRNGTPRRITPRRTRPRRTPHLRAAVNNVRPRVGARSTRRCRRARERYLVACATPARSMGKWCRARRERARLDGWRGSNWRKRQRVRRTRRTAPPPPRPCTSSVAHVCRSANAFPWTADRTWTSGAVAVA